MKNGEKWFNENFMPILRSPSRDCDCCVFKGIRHPYCINLSCWYLDNCLIHTFYWTSKYNLKYNIPDKVKDFFYNTNKEEIKEISRTALKNALIKKTNIKESMMEKNVALDLAKRWVSNPKFVGQKWIVEWLDRTIIRKEQFDMKRDADLFYYRKVEYLKNKITNHGK